MQFEYNGFAKSGGIYQIKNTNNNKIYIGSSACFQVRWSQHKKELSVGKHPNKHLQSAYNIDGPDAWHFTVLEVVVAETKETGKIARKAAEQVWIDKHYGPECYNIKSKADTSRADVPSKDPSKTFELLSLHAKKLWSDPEMRAKFSAVHKGKKVSAETRAKQSAAATGRVMSVEATEKSRSTRANKTEEEKAKISEKLRAASQTPEGLQRTAILVERAVQRAIAKKHLV
jgi:group I intron endonuclease